MSEQLQLKPRNRRMFEEILRDPAPGVEKWAYGSRVSGQSHDGSDLDLVLRGPDLEEIPTGQLIDLEDALRLSTIPFLVEVRDWARLPESFHREFESGCFGLVSAEQRAKGWKLHQVGLVRRHFRL